MDKEDKTIDMSDTFVADVGQKSAVANFDNTTSFEKTNGDNQEFNNSGNFKKKKKNPFRIILLVILSIGIGAFGSYYYFEIYNTKDSTKITKTSKNSNFKDDNEEMELSVDSLFVKNLLARYDYDPVIGINKYNYLYKEDKTLVSDLDKDFVRVVTAADAQNRALLGSLTFSGESFQNSLTKLFGSEYTLENETIKNDVYCVNIKYDEKENIYTVSEPACGGTSNFELLTKLVKATITEEKQVTINVAIAIKDSSENKIYKKLDISNENENYSGIDELEGVDGETFSIDKDYSKLNQYKYVFKYDKNNNNYYLVSIELDK